MAVPKQRKTKSRQGQRRAQQKMTAPQLTSCEKCGKTKRTHTVCQSCGFYRGEEVVNVLDQLEKKERKQKEREIEEQEQERRESGGMSPEELSKK